jgi:hypothetical protein
MHHHLLSLPGYYQGVDADNGGLLFACAGIAVPRALRDAAVPRTSSPQPTQNSTGEGDGMLLLNPGANVSTPILEADIPTDNSSFVEAPDYKVLVTPDGDRPSNKTVAQADPDPDWGQAFNLSSRPAATKKIW